MQLPSMNLLSRDNGARRYDWVVRLNPDVMLVRDDWLLKTMSDPTVDGIFNQQGSNT